MSLAQGDPGVSSLVRWGPAGAGEAWRGQLGHTCSDEGLGEVQLALRLGGGFEDGF